MNELTITPNYEHQDLICLVDTPKSITYKIIDEIKKEHNKLLTSSKQRKLWHTLKNLDKKTELISKYYHELKKVPHAKINRFLKKGIYQIEIQAHKKTITKNIPCYKLNTSYLQYLKQIKEPIKILRRTYCTNMPLETQIFDIKPYLIKMIEDNIIGTTNCDEETYINNWIERLLGDK